MIFSSYHSSRKRCGGVDENPGHWGYRKRRKKVLCPGGKGVESNAVSGDAYSGLSWVIERVWRSGSQHSPIVGSRNTEHPR
jgi:hypothetical protein